MNRLKRNKLYERSKEITSILTRNLQRLLLRFTSHKDAPIVTFKYISMYITLKCIKDKPASRGGCDTCLNKDLSGGNVTFYKYEATHGNVGLFTIFD